LHRHGDDDEFFLLKLAEDTIVTDTLSPEARKVITEGLSERARAV
jgi:hypothetical protein